MTYPSLPKGSKLWWQETDEQARGEAVVRTVDQLEHVHQERRGRALDEVETYEGRALGSLAPSAFFKSTDLQSDKYDYIRANEARACVSTAIAKIAGKQRPKAQFCCSEADWSTKRKAKRLEKFVEAVMLERQNGLTDAYAVGLLMFRDCCVTDSGWIKVWADTAARKVCVQRVLPWEVLVDPNEARYGEPQNLFHVYGYDRYLLAEQFPDRADMILAANGLEEDKDGAILYGYGSDSARMIKVRECWRLPPSPDKPGKHAIVIQTPTGYADLTVSKKNKKGDAWTRPFFPFEMMVWEPWMLGIYGTSLVANIAGMCDELNASMQRWAEAELLASNLVIFADRDSVHKEDLEDNRPAIVIDIEPGSRDPRFHVPETTSNTSISWQKYLIERIHDTSGISEQASTGTTQLGANASGEALREENKMGSERFSIQWQNFERVMAIGCARQIVACMRELCEKEGEDIIVKWPGGDYLQEIPWSKVSLEDDAFHVQVYAVSGLVGTPQDRLALATELVDRGFMSREAYLRVIQAKDLDAELGQVNTASQWTDKKIEMWLDWEEGEDTKKLLEPPPRWLGVQVLTDMILRVGIAYLEADIAGAPQENLSFFEQFMWRTSQVVDEQSAHEAELKGATTGNTAATQAIQAATPGGPPPPGAAPAPAVAVHVTPPAPAAPPGAPPPVPPPQAA